MWSLFPPGSFDSRDDVDEAARSALGVAFPDLFPPSDEVLYAGLDEKMTAYMRARLAERPQLLSTFVAAARLRAETRRSPKAVPEWAYFIQSGLRGLIKIGCAVDVDARRASLQSGSAERLYVLAVMPGGASVEYQLHARFAEYRIHGEWFAPARELTDFIGGIA